MARVNRRPGRRALLPGFMRLRLSKSTLYPRYSSDTTSSGSQTVPSSSLPITKPRRGQHYAKNQPHAYLVAALVPAFPCVFIYIYIHMHANITQKDFLCIPKFFKQAPGLWARRRPLGYQPLLRGPASPAPSARKALLPEVAIREPEIRAMTGLRLRGVD